MTDKELLESAARAAGLKLYWNNGRTYMRPDMELMDLWNPLTDDGDALRLSVHLNIGISQYAGIAPGFVRAGENIGLLITEIRGVDPFAATRRAIVRAAAALDRRMTPECPLDLGD